MYGREHAPVAPAAAAARQGGAKAIRESPYLSQIKRLADFDPKSVVFPTFQLFAAKSPRKMQRKEPPLAYLIVPAICARHGTTKLCKTSGGNDVALRVERFDTGYPDSSTIIQRNGWVNDYLIKIPHRHLETSQISSPFRLAAAQCFAVGVLGDAPILWGDIVPDSPKFDKKQCINCIFSCFNQNAF